MRDMELSQHTRDMLQEREIPEEWMWQALDEPDWIKIGTDGNTHYIKAIPEHGGRFLRVVVNPRTQRIVTLFFGRRLRRQKR